MSPSEIFLEPIHGELDSTLAMGRIGQTMIRTTDDMNLFGDTYVVEDSQGLIERNKFIFFSVNDETMRDLL